MFFSNIGSMFETYNVTLEVYIGKQIANKQSLEAPKEIIITNFMQLAQQIGQDTRPMKIIISRPETIWNNIRQEQKSLMHEVAFLNNAMIAFEEENSKK